MLIDEQRAVGIAIEGRAKIGALKNNAVLQTFEVERAAIAVDVAAIRLDINCNDSSTETVEEFWGQFIRGAVGAVDDHREISNRKIMSNIVREIFKIATAQFSAVSLFV